MNAEKIFYLDWNTQKLFGWEKEKSNLVIDAIIRGIEAGDDFPAVGVHRDETDCNKFYISSLSECITRSLIERDYVLDGGHHRAVGHYKVRKPLKCKLKEGGPVILDSMCIEISDILIVADKGEYQRRKNAFPNDYR